MSETKIMFVADLCGRAGRQAASHMIKSLKEQFSADYVICNVENAAGGFGVTPEMSKKVFSYGADIQTSGNHIWDRQEIIKYINTEPKLLRPANYPNGTPGNGYFIDTFDNNKIGVINLMGRTFMKDIDCPFRLAEEIVDKIKHETNLIFIDFHAEATSEKQALCYHLDGLVTAIIGTHTHVQTADEKITKRGTAYITDAGMTGAHDSIIGMQSKPSVERFLSGMPIRFSPATDDVKISGVVIIADENSGEATNIERFKIDFNIDDLPKNNNKPELLDEV
jgi:metallophosphoesterase (TIGR00282 family)